LHTGPTVAGRVAAEKLSEWPPALLSEAELSAWSTCLKIGAKRVVAGATASRPGPEPASVEAAPPAHRGEAGAGTKPKKGTGGTLGLAELRGRKAAAGPVSEVPQGAAFGAAPGVMVSLFGGGFASCADSREELLVLGDAAAFQG
jgi:hypothetical protein